MSDDRHLHREAADRIAELEALVEWWENRYELVAIRIAELEAKVAQAVAELDGEHRPQWVGDVGYTEEPVEEGREPVGCVMCYPHDSDWPCASRMIADELRRHR